MPTGIDNRIEPDVNAGVGGAAGCDDVATSIRTGGQKKNQLSLLPVLNDLKVSPLFQLRQGSVGGSIGASAVVKIDCLGGLNFRRLHGLILRRGGDGNGGTGRETDKKEVGKISHAQTS
jgi:hypothetical protein